MKLRVLAFGITVGLFLGLAVFLAGAFSILFGTGENIGAIRWFVPGFNRHWPGAFTGLVVAALEGFVLGSAFAWLYNRILRALEK